MTTAKSDNGEKLLNAAINSANFAEHHIKSFEYFIDTGLQNIIDSQSMIEPVILPPGIKEFKIKLGKIKIGKPDRIEVDGILRPIMPMEARLRDLTYDAPMMLTISYIADGKVIREEDALIGRMPIVIKSKFCNLYGLSDEELIAQKEDPSDPGGYFIINGTERIIITTEDLAPNNLLISKENQEGFLYSAKIFADAESIKVPHTLLLSANNLLYISFGKIKKIPILILLKALGFTNTNELFKRVGDDEYKESVLNINTMAFEIGSEKEALEYIGKSLHSMHPIETAESNIDTIFLPFLGIDKSSRNLKAEYLIYTINQLLVHARDKKEVDKDHYRNKRLHGENYNLDMLFRFIFKQVLNDAKYNFERGIKRDRIPSPQYIFISDQLTSRLVSSLATGQWVGGRVGITQHLDRRSFPSTISHLRKVESLLTSNRENYRARDLHGTHFGRFCAVETPEGGKIGLTKNIAIFAKISEDNLYEKEFIEKIKRQGVKEI